MAQRPQFGSVEINRELVPRLIGLQVGVCCCADAGRPKPIDCQPLAHPDHAAPLLPLPCQGVNLSAIEEKTAGRLIVADTGEVSVYAPTQRAYAHAVAAAQEVEGLSYKAGQVFSVKVGGHAV